MLTYNQLKTNCVSKKICPKCSRDVKLKPYILSDFLIAMYSLRQIEKTIKLWPSEFSSVS